MLKKNGNYHMHLVSELKVINWLFQCQFIKKKTLNLNTSSPALPETICLGKILRVK